MLGSQEEWSMSPAETSRPLVKVKVKLKVKVVITSSVLLYLLCYYVARQVTRFTHRAFSSSLHNLTKDVGLHITCRFSAGSLSAALVDPSKVHLEKDTRHISQTGALRGIEGRGGHPREGEAALIAARQIGRMDKWREFVEKVSVLQLVLTFLFMGGRRSEWMRSWPVWRHFKNYFPVKLVKTAELSPNKNYILGSHPHGIMCMGAISCFSTTYGGFSQAFPGMRVTLAILAGLFRLPIFRDYLMSAGMCPVSKPSLEYLLSRNGKGNAVVIVTGGAAESLSSAPGVNTVVMRQRKGFVRLALEYGADLVPVYSFGENELFQQVVFSEGSMTRGLQIAFKKIMGFAPCLFMGQSWGLLPYKTPVTTVVGSPIAVPRMAYPSEETVDHYHSLYMEALTKLFHDHKVSCGLSESHDLHII
ncbi:diacylglycerol O-acyltransferase 2-like [Scleropages formosus]|uniref:Acyltransferase n=1 Tax=Scleropages formosus TaxID=113540 RepID=A0A0N8K2B6_SCLFO|nr:diacylglycerol O-acyltransferase 2-like [Scleropages formosus]